MLTSNYDGYSLFPDQDTITWEWMDFYRDIHLGPSEDKPVFTIEVLWNNKIDDSITELSMSRVTSEEIVPGECQIITFNAVNYYTLIQRST